MPASLNVFALATLAFFALPMGYLFGLDAGKKVEGGAYRSLLEDRLPPMCLDRLLAVEENRHSGERWDAKLPRER